MLVYLIVMIVNSVDAFLVKDGRGDVAIEVLVCKLRGEFGYSLAHVHAEGYEHHPGRVVEAMLLEFLEGQVNKGILLIYVRMLLEFNYENGFRELLSLRQILVQCRH